MQEKTTWEEFVNLYNQLSPTEQMYILKSAKSIRFERKFRKIILASVFVYIVMLITYLLS